MQFVANKSFGYKNETADTVKSYPQKCSSASDGKRTHYYCINRITV